MLSLKDLEIAQNEWAKFIIQIGKLHLDKSSNLKDYTLNGINTLYDTESELLFKPTKASEIPFRPSLESALSYFIGSNSSFSEDKGFALEPWKHVVFNNSSTSFSKNMCFANGHYFFTNLENKDTKVEYTFGYKAVPSTQNLKIFIHHSSLPYSAL